MSARRIGQLFAACVVLGLGVGLLLLAALGSDGYSTMINGISIATGVPFVVVASACAASALFVFLPICILRCAPHHRGTDASGLSLRTKGGGVPRSDCSGCA